MLLFKKIDDLQAHLQKLRNQGTTIGFTPTMGALHEGHLSLIRKSTATVECSVCSIFVNPTQFNDAGDLEKYPRTTSQDIELLATTDCGVLFLPPVSEIYPQGPNSTASLDLDFGYLDQPMEGAHRPGHFAGMAQVVKRLLDIVQPDRLFMGQKDYQQAAIVRRMLELQKSSIELVVCPIVREPDGLAMSSRNVRLTPAQRQLAPRIHQVLAEIKKSIRGMAPRDLEAAAIQRLTAPGMVPEYFEIVDGHTLQRVHDFGDVQLAVACTAVQLGDIRLIDNMVLLDNL